MKKLKVGIVGCGFIARGKHLPALKNLSDTAEITALCDIIKERADDMNEKFANGKAKIFTDYKEMLKLELDAVYVCTPNVSHAEITVAALESGKHVMCEKPMAINSREAQKMLDAQKKSGKLLTIGYQNRYRNDSVFLKKCCEAGDLGEIYFAKAHAVRRRGVPTWGVFLDKEKQGGGPLIDIGTHALDLALYSMNNYEPLYACGTTYHKLNSDTQTANSGGDWDPKKFTVEDSAFGFVVMKNGATIFLESSWALNTTDVREASVTLCGTKGGATMPQIGKLELNGVKNNAKFAYSPDFVAGTFAYLDGKPANEGDLEAKTFLDAISGRGKLVVLPEQAMVVTKILEGIYDSAETGKPHYFER
jgi:predicted dehydrogenase